MKKYISDLQATARINCSLFSRITFVPWNCAWIQAPFSGIIAGIVGGIVIGSLSKSPLSVSGPAAGLTAIVAAAILKLPSYETFLTAVVMAGVIQVFLGFIKAGMIGDFVPNAVIKGMLAAIGIILILKQLPHLVGYDSDFLGDETFIQPDQQNTFSEVFNSLNYFSPGASLIGIISILILMGFESKKIKSHTILKQIPAPLIVVLLGIGMNAFFKSNLNGFEIKKEHLVNLPEAKNLSDFLKLFTFPNFQSLSNPIVWSTALTIAIVASLETLLSIEAIDKLDPYKRVTPTNLELKAQGIGNIISGLIGGLPMTSVIVRSSANVNAGGKSKQSTIFHAILLLVSVISIPNILNMIPLAALAAILIFTGYKLSKYSLFTEFYKKGTNQFIPFLITIFAILLTDLLIGILIGIGVALMFMIWSNFRSSVMIVNDKNNYLFRFRKDVSFLNKPLIKRKLEEVPANSFIMIDTSRADFIDKDIIDVINEFRQHAHFKNISVEIKKKNEINSMQKQL